MTVHKMVNMHEAKSQLSKLISDFVNMGTEVVVANAGAPVAKLVPYHEVPSKRIGFMANELPSLPTADGFNRMHDSEIADLFEGA